MGSGGWAWVQVDFKYQWRVVSLDVSNRRSFQLRFANIEVCIKKKYICQDFKAQVWETIFLLSSGSETISTGLVLDQLVPTYCVQLKLAPRPTKNFHSQILISHIRFFGDFSAKI